VEKADGVGAAADAGHEQIRQAFLFLQDLPTGFVADHPLEISHHQRVRVSAVDRTEYVMGRAEVGDPVAHGFIYGFLQGLLSGLDGHDFRSEHFHAVDIERLTRAIHRPHIDDALQAEHRGDGSGGDTMLSGAGLGDDAGLAHAPCQEDLTDAIVDFVRPRVQEVLALEVDLGSAQFAGQALGEVKGCGTTAEFLEVIVQLTAEGRVLDGLRVFTFQFLQRVHQGLGNIASSVGPKMAANIRHNGGCGSIHALKLAANWQVVHSETPGFSGRGVVAGGWEVERPGGDRKGKNCCNFRRPFGSVSAESYDDLRFPSSMKTLRHRLSSPVVRRVGKVAVVAGLLVVLFVKLKLSPVAVVGHAVETRPVVAEVMGTGTLEARITTTVSPRIQEQLIEVLVDQGESVREGELLVRLDDSELRQQVAVAEAALEAAQATANRVRIDEARAAAVEEQARQDYQRESDLLTGGVSSQAERDKALERLRIAESDLKTAHATTTEAVLRVVTAEKSLLFEKERLAYTEITSPYAGLVIRRDRDPGEVVVPGSSILQLISTNELWISAWVDETAMADLATGQTARVVFRSEPSRSHPGVVTRLGRQTDRETREFLVDVRVERLPLNWAVGQRGEVYIETAREDAALAIPEIFVHWRNGKPGVFVDREGKARWQGVVLGLQGAGVVQVLQGLQGGDWVVMLAPGRRGTLVDGQRIQRP